MKRKWLTTLVLMACAHMGAQAAGVTDAMIENDAKSTGDVLSWGMGPQGQRHSTLDSANLKTV